MYIFLLSFVIFSNVLSCVYNKRFLFFTSVELLFLDQDELHSDEVRELTLVTVQEIVNAWCGTRLRN